MGEINTQLIAGIGAAAAIFLSAVGSGYGSVHAGIFALQTFDSSGWFFAFAPIVIAGVLSIYGIIVAVIIAGKMEGMESTLAYKCFSAGFSVGLSCLASGLAMGKFLDKYLAGPSTSSARPSSEIERPLVGSSRSLRSAPCSGWGLLIVMVFLEAIGLYGLIVALILSA